MKKRGWTGEIYCCLCGEVETTNHVFFGYSVARFTWCCLRDAFGWAGCPSNLGDVLGDKFLGVMKIPAHLKLFVIVGITWAIWRSRNKMAIEKLFPKNFLDVIRSGVAFVQKWRLLLGKSDQASIAKLGEKMMAWFQIHTPSLASVSDIVEL